MNLYLESNFVLELVLRQEEAESCDVILGMAAQGSVIMVIPGFSLIEPYLTISAREKERRRVAESIAQQLRELARSLHHHSEAEELRNRTTALLIRSGEEQRNRLADLQTRLLKQAQIIPLSAKIIGASADLQMRHGLSVPDAMVCASILQHLDMIGADNHCFVTKDKKDLVDSDVRSDFEMRGCRVLFGFENGLRYLRKFALGKP